MGKGVMTIKNVVYALRMRVMGHPRKSSGERHAPMLIEAAVKELEDALQVYTDSNHISKGAPLPTVHKLDSHLITDKGDHSLY
jgi:hypothetical protein